jgi:hypothetical protein
MGNVIEFELIAAERSSEFIREAARRHRAEEAAKAVGLGGVVAFIFGRKRAA